MASNDEGINIPYIAYEASQARFERIIRRLVVVLVVAIVLLFASNAGWLWAWMQYDYCGEETELTYTQDGHGVNVIGASVIGDGNRVADPQDQNENPNAHP